eukprot:Phypoly_transcript_15316.p1 GENE.Phypoly_transcript_15316~~Phypoly_transcript_15316.p1  ORF type:complete len:302 (+),score=32.13 Phypoly_transcript_15316:109-906(+)
MELKTKEQLENKSPSKKDNISSNEEYSLRKGTCIFIQQAGYLLKFPQITTVTALVLFHRFFSRRSYSRYDRFLIAATCLYLAAKTAETPRKIRDIVNVTYQILNNKTLRISSEYWDLKDVIVKMESVVLRTLAFDLSIAHPHNYLLNYLYSLKVDERLAQLSWNILSDSYYTNICLQHKPNEVASAAIFLAAKILQLEIPDGEEKKWWMVFGADFSNIEDICNQIMELYEGGIQQEVYAGTSEWMKLVDRKSNPNTPNSTPHKEH